MLQVMSTNQAVGQAGTIPLTDVSLIKGNTATKNGNTVMLNRCGVYKIEVDGSVTIPAGNSVSIEMEKNGVVQANAVAIITSVADQVENFAFNTFVQVPFNNTPNPCTAPTTIEFVTNEATTYVHFNVLVTKIA